MVCTIANQDFHLCWGVNFMTIFGNFEYISGYSSTKNPSTDHNCRNSRISTRTKLADIIIPFTLAFRPDYDVSGKTELYPLRLSICLFCFGSHHFANRSRAPGDLLIKQDRHGVRDAFLDTICSLNERLENSIIMMLPSRKLRDGIRKTRRVLSSSHSCGDTSRPTLL